MWTTLAIVAMALTWTPPAGGQAAGGAAADPGVCRGAPAAAGATIRGPILHVPDAGVVCVARGADPGQWVPVPLARPADSRQRLLAAAFGQNAVCRIDASGAGDCVVAGAALAERLRRPDVARASAAWR